MPETINFPPFPIKFSTLSQRTLTILPRFDVLFANAFEFGPV